MEDWTISWINPQNEASYKARTLLLSGPYGQERIDKVWPASQDLSPEFLLAQAEKEIERIITENTPAPAPIVEEIV